MHYIILHSLAYLLTCLCAVSCQILIHDSFIPFRARRNLSARLHTSPHHLTILFCGSHRDVLKRRPVPTFAPPCRSPAATATSRTNVSPVASITSSSFSCTFYHAQPGIFIPHNDNGSFTNLVKFLCFTSPASALLRYPETGPRL